MAELNKIPYKLRQKLRKLHRLTLETSQAELEVYKMLNEYHPDVSDYLSAMADDPKNNLSEDLAIIVNAECTDENI